MPKAVDPGSENGLSELTPQQQVFAYEYIKDWNGTRAADRAGYSGDDNVLAVQASRLLRNVKVQEFISAYVESVGMSAKETIMLIGEHARASLRPFYTEGGEDGELWPDLTTDAAQQNFHLLKKVKIKKRVGGPPEDRWTETETELEIHDRLAAQTLMGRHHKLFTDKVEQSGALTIRTAKDLTDDELAEIAAQQC